MIFGLLNHDFANLDAVLIKIYQISAKGSQSTPNHRKIQQRLIGRTVPRKHDFISFDYWTWLGWGKLEESDPAQGGI
jgi:hypothetical protein